MEKIIESLSKLLPEDQVAGLSEAVSEYLENARKELEAEFSTKLEEAYSDMHTDIQKTEETGIQGYQEAYAVIQDLRNRLAVQQTEYENAIDEGYEEAYQIILAERGKNEGVELEVYDAAENKLSEIREEMIDQVTAFLEYKNSEIYEQARRDILNDPRMAEHKVTLDRVVETVQNYISDEDYALATSTKLDAAHKASEELQGKVRILEARNVRLDVQNRKLDEQVRQAAQLINESTQQSAKDEKKERAEKAQNAQGRGKTHTGDAELIAEYSVTQPEETNTDNTFAEAFDTEELHRMQVLAGTKAND